MGLTLLDRVNLLRINACAGFREWARWRDKAVRDEPRVFYGYDCLPRPGETVSGGLVKLLDLTARFPNCRKGANIVYLVSSALPPAVGRMVDRAKKAGARIVLNQNGVAYPAWHGPGWEEANAPMKFVVQAADHVFYQSAFCRLGADRFLGERKGPSEILFNPVDTTVFVPGPSRADRESPVLLLAGSHWHFYRIQTAVETIALVRKIHPKARLVIAGRFRWRPNPVDAEREARDLCRKLGVADAVEFQGPYTQAQAVPLLQSAHILLHTKYNDPCPRLVVEAMACGLPVVYSATGGVPELVGEYAGVGAPGPLDWEKDHPPSPDQMAQGVDRILERWPDYSAAARERAVRQLGTTSWINRHHDVFRDLLFHNG